MKNNKFLIRSMKILVLLRYLTLNWIFSTEVRAYVSFVEKLNFVSIPVKAS